MYWIEKRETILYLLGCKKQVKLLCIGWFTKNRKDTFFVLIVLVGLQGIGKYTSY